MSEISSIRILTEYIPSLTPEEIQVDTQQKLSNIVQRDELTTKILSRVAGYGLFILVTGASFVGGRAIDNHVDTHQINKLAEYQAEVLPEKQRLIDERQQNLEKLKISFGDRCISDLEKITGSLTGYPEEQKTKMLINAPGHPCGTYDIPVLDKKLRYENAIQALRDAQDKQNTSLDHEESELRKQAEENQDGWQIGFSILGGAVSALYGLNVYFDVDNRRHNLAKDRVMAKYRRKIK